MKQIILNNGVVEMRTPQATVKHRAVSVPSRRLDKLEKLLKDGTPHICLVRGEGIGDVIMATPLIHQLHEHFKGNVNLYFATNTKYLGGALYKVLLHNPELQGIIDREALDDSEFDAVLNIHCPAIGYEVHGNPPVNRIDLFARHVGFETLIDPKPRYFIQPSEIQAGQELYRSFGLMPQDVVLLVNPFASNKRRSIDENKIRETLTTLYHAYKVKSIILRHSTDSMSNVEWGNIPGAHITRDLDIRQIAGLMIHTSLLLCPDSAMLHLAGALDFPTVTLFGPTDPRARINYYPNATAIWEGNHYNPCPCWYTNCPIGYICWNMVTAEKITNKIIEQLRVAHKPDIATLLARGTITSIRSETL